MSPAGRLGRPGLAAPHGGRAPTTGRATAERRDRGLERKPKVKKSLDLVLEEAEIIELLRILIDDDAEGALAFLKAHVRGKARELLEGG